MECDRAGGLLSGLIDNALRPLARLRVNRHVAGCDACATKLEELRSMQAAVRTKLPYHRAPPGLAARIGASLPREEVPASPVQARGRGSGCRHSAWQERGWRVPWPAWR